MTRLLPWRRRQRGSQPRCRPNLACPVWHCVMLTALSPPLSSCALYTHNRPPIPHTLAHSTDMLIPQHVNMVTRALQNSSAANRRLAETRADRGTDRGTDTGAPGTGTGTSPGRGAVTAAHSALALVKLRSLQAAASQQRSRSSTVSGDGRDASPRSSGASLMRQDPLRRGRRAASRGLDVQLGGASGGGSAGGRGGGSSYTNPGATSPGRTSVGNGHTPRNEHGGTRSQRRKRHTVGVAQGAALAAMTGRSAPPAFVNGHGCNGDAPSVPAHVVEARLASARAAFAAAAVAVEAELGSWGRARRSDAWHLTDILNVRRGAAEQCAAGSSGCCLWRRCNCTHTCVRGYPPPPTPPACVMGTRARRTGVLRASAGPHP